MKSALFGVGLVLIVLGAALATVEIHDKDHLSKHTHFEGEHHNTQYDHDAFLGPKQALEFEELSEEDAKKRLRVMIPRVDLDKDGLVSPDELEAWIEKQRKIFMYDAVDEDLATQDTDGDKTLSWTEYMKAVFGESEDENFPKDEVLRGQIRRTKRKFDAADRDKNGKLDRDEYVNFQHPEEADYMEEIAIDEILEEVDKNEDGFVSIAEFLSQYGDGEIPKWVEEERKHFGESFDLNGNGKLEREELHKWVIPTRGESRDEMEHLMDGSDENADGFLSTDEIILHFDLFVGSKATDHGETLKRIQHDEF